MSTQRWTKKRLTAAEQRAAAREKALAQCAKGNHTSTPTFRPGETVCITCGLVVYCPLCLTSQKLQLPYGHAYTLTCSIHQKAEVQV
jgi:hypothetical protein